MNNAWLHSDMFFATTVTGNGGNPCLHRVHGQQGVGAGEEEYVPLRLGRWFCRYSACNPDEEVCVCNLGRDKR